MRRLREAFGEDVTLEAAYGDSDGDREMLAMARERGYRGVRAAAMRHAGAAALERLAPLLAEICAPWTA